MATSTDITNLNINVLTKAQYNNATKETNDLYCVTDEIPSTATNFTATNSLTSNGTLKVQGKTTMNQALAFTLTDKKNSITFNGTNLLDLIYPVGSIYMSVNSTSPQSFFGGTWTRIQDAFLFAAGTTHSAGSTGGEETHVLTVAEQPAVSNDFTIRAGVSNSAKILQAWSGNGVTTEYDTDKSTPMSMSGNTQFSTKITIVNGGQNQAHNNMPPYLAVYMWKRTA